MNVLLTNPMVSIVSAFNEWLQPHWRSRRRGCRSTGRGRRSACHPETARQPAQELNWCRLDMFL